MAADTLHATDSSLVKLTIVTVILIVILLLIAYRSITIALIPLFGVLTTLAVARGIISFLVGQGVIEISSFASNLLVSLVWVPRRTTRFSTWVDTRKPVKKAKTRNRRITSPSPTCRTSSWGRVLRSRAPPCA